MSNKTDSSEIILIAPETNNQDGTHTYYILDPCPQEESIPESKIELIDLTAEVTNTGNIAVLSTNSSTGAWEINLTRQADSMDKGNVINLESEGSSTVIEETFFDDDGESVCIVKDEDEDVDVEGVSQTDVYPSSGEEIYVLKSETGSIYFENEPSAGETEELTSLPEQHEQDDEPEEDTLYIDDVRFSGSQENMQNNLKIVGTPDTDLMDGKKETNSLLQKMKSIIEDADLVMKETEDCMREDKESREKQTTATQNCASENHNSREAVLEKNVIDLPSQTQEVSDIEYVDSTNTALTLLELAGGSYRNTADEVEMEEDSLENQETIDNPDVSQEGQLTMLTTLQPVPVEIPEITETTKVVPEMSTEQETNKADSPAASSHVGRLKTNIKIEDVQTQIERLKEGDSPFNSETKRYYRGLSSPIVSQKEIADKLIERTKSKVPYSEPKDIFFTMKIAHRLANRIVPPEKGESENSFSDKEMIDQVTSVTDKDDHKLNTPVSRKGSISYSEVRSVTPSQEKSAISDKYELLKILEDDPDDPDDIPDLPEGKLLNKIINKTNMIRRSKNKFSPLIKLHPELEKELALKQLQDFSSSRSGRKSFNKLEVTIQNHREHNNNTNRKRRSGDTFSKNKKMKGEDERSVEDSSLAVTVDPSLVTETLAVEGQEAVSDPTKDSKSIKQYSNKRLSRNSETPPREIPMEILLNGVEEDVDLLENGKAKNKIFKATNPRKRQEELKKKKQTHFANVLQRNKPQKKRGRPPKKKVSSLDTFNDDLIIHPGKKNKLQNGEDKQESENSVYKENESPKDEKLQKGKKLTEIEKLLGDEGAINMLYSVEQKRNVGNEPKSGILPSYRRKKKDLMLKTKLVKSAVLRLSASPAQNEGRISLRERSTKEENEETQSEIALRKISVDSHDSHHSANSGNAEVFPFPAKIVPAEASRIIRRHSSSSNYSSRSNSPRRQSFDGSEQPNVLPSASSETGQGDIPHKHKHTKSSHQVEAGQGDNLLVSANKHTKPSNQEESTQVKRLSKDVKRTSLPRRINNTPATSTAKKIQQKVEVKPIPGKPRGRPRRVLVTEDEKKKSSELESSLSAALNEVTKKIEGIDSNIATPKKTGSPIVSRIGSASKMLNKGNVDCCEITLIKKLFLYSIYLFNIKNQVNKDNTNIQ